MNHTRLSAALASVLIGLASNAMATLVPIGPQPLSGQGLGAVNTIMTLQNAPTESGQVSWNGTSVVTTGDTTALNTVYTMAQLGATSFSDLVIIFNGNEVESGGNASIQLDFMSIDLYQANGTPLQSFSIDATPDFYTTFPGVGSSGFGYEFDVVQAGQADFLFSQFSDLRIGATANVSLTSDGPESFSIATRTPPGQVPEGGTTVLLLGSAFLGLALVRRQFCR